MSRALSFIFCVFFMLTMRDIFFKGSSHARQSMEEEDPSLMTSTADDESSMYSAGMDGHVTKEIPKTKLHQIPNANTITIYYCYSCGYKKAFEEYSKALLERDPTLVVNGEHYQPTGGRMYLAQFISLAKFAFMAIVITGFWPAQLDSFVPANIKAWIFNHKLYACLMVFFLSNTIESSMMSSGAFEIYYNDILIWSKMKSGTILPPTELIKQLQKFHGDVETNSEHYDF